jgi:hypothetical protein
MQVYEYSWRACIKVELQKQLTDIIELPHKITIRKDANEAQEQSIMANGNNSTELVPLS